jgi:transposase
MRTAPAIFLNPEQRSTLERLVRQRLLPARIVEWARIMLLVGEGLENRQIAAWMGITLEKVARWQKRFLKGGIAAFEKDAPHPGRRRISRGDRHHALLPKVTELSTLDE